MGVNVRLFPEIYSWTILEWLSNGFSIGLLVFFGILMSQVTYPDRFPDSYAWTDYAYFIPRFFPLLEWWLAFILGVFVFCLPAAAFKVRGPVITAPPALLHPTR